MRILNIKELAQWMGDLWKAPHTMKKQKLACENAITEFNDGQEQLVIRMRKSQNALCNAYQQAILAKKSIEQAAENLRLNENYYKAGISTMSDLLEAQTLFQQSKDRYSEAYSTYEIKKDRISYINREVIGTETRI